MDINDLFNKLTNIETNRFLLREIRDEDYKEIFDIYSKDEVLKYQNMVPMKNLDEAVEYVNFISEGYKNKRFIRWGIAGKEDDRVIGLVALHHIESGNSKVSIGYILNKRFWRQKIMSEVMDVIVDFVFNELNLNRIEASIHPDNSASIKLCEKLGFKKEGLKAECIFNKNTNIFEDRLMYGMIKKNYQQNKE
ncbi:GNAT family N-acetyltransferase [Wukongibacter baidiensis]